MYVDERGGSVGCTCFWLTSFFTDGIENEDGEQEQQSMASSSSSTFCLGGGEAGGEGCAEAFIHAEVQLGLIVSEARPYDGDRLIFVFLLIDWRN